MLPGLPRKSGQCPYLVPLSSGSCEYQCRSDYNCNGTEKCCSNGCGTQCVQPMVMTGKFTRIKGGIFAGTWVEFRLPECQHKRAIVQHESHESGIPARHIFVPTCREEDGAFEPVQCHPTTGQCWCVDAHGTEVAGTRAAPGIRPNCKGKYWGISTDLLQQDCINELSHVISRFRWLVKARLAVRLAQVMLG